jgi:hypothetical protein
MLMTLRVLLNILGLSAILIGLSVFFLGPQFAAGLSEHLFDTLTGWRGPSSGRWPSTMDSELRFYAPFWGAYGVLLIVVAGDLRRQGHWVPWLALLFFAGGVGRAISYFAVGAPHPFFSALMTIELVTPPILAGLWWAARRRA